MQIVNSTLEDIEAIFELYDKATEFQKTKFDKHWQGFDVALVEKEIRENHLWKIVICDQIACIFSLDYSDAPIWGEREDGLALYIHRIVTNPLFRGQGFVKIIVEWAKEYGRCVGKKFIRIGTWEENRKLKNYYKNCGFTFVGITTPTFTETLPKHYEGSSVALLEMSTDN